MTKPITILILLIISLLFSVNCLALEIACRIGDKYPEGGPNHESGWKDGQIVEIREDGFSWGEQSYKDFVIIRVSGDFWKIRGSRDWKSTNPSVLNLKKYLSVKDKSGKYDWEEGSLASKGKKEAASRKRDYFVDYRRLLNEGLITQVQYDNIYDKTIANYLIILPAKTLDTLLLKEDTHKRLKKK